MRDVVLSLATVAVYITVGCADSVVEVRGRVVDTDSQPFERCEVLLYQGASPKVLDTAVVTGGSIGAGFTINELWTHKEIGIRCDDALESFRGARIDWTYNEPVHLGTVELPRRE